jgi:hypothetical protein
VVLKKEGFWNNRDQWFCDSDGYLKKTQTQWVIYQIIYICPTPVLTRPPQNQILSCEENPRVIIFLWKEIKRK